MGEAVLRQRASVDGHRADSAVAPYEWEPAAQRNALPHPGKRAKPAELRVGWPAVIAGVYVVGLVALLGRLLFGLVGCRRLVQGGRALEPVHLLSGCSAALGTALRRYRLLVMVCPAVRTPVTVGCLRSRILLPGDWSDWSDSKREAAARMSWLMSSGAMLSSRHSRRSTSVSTGSIPSRGCCPGAWPGSPSRRATIVLSR